MRTPIIAGNWKMNKSLAESIEFARDLVPRLSAYSSVERVICPTFVALAGVSHAVQGTPIKVGAQNVSTKEKGAYTSQIAANMLVGLAEYVIIGHSECREFLGETDDDINAKAKMLLQHGLKPILACGENLAVNEAGGTVAHVESQIRAGLKDINAEQMGQIVIAYEPIWAIGSGKSASAEFANDIIGAIRTTIESLYGATAADGVRIQYGGSVKPSNMREYMIQPHIDGALVGGAALLADDFVSLVQIAAETKG